MFRYFMLSFVLSFGVMATALAKTHNLSIEGDHGKLFAALQTPDYKQSYPLVILLHGIFANKEVPILKHIADNLEHAGIASIRFDFNGHGLSEGTIQDMTIINEMEDTKKVYAFARALPQVTTISLAGHSQGGLIASIVAGELGADNIKSLALLAPAFALRDYVRSGQIFGKAFNVQYPPEYIEIFKGVRVGRNYIETLKNFPIYELAEKYRGPTIIVHGMNDTIIPYTDELYFHKIYTDSVVNLLPSTDHNFVPKIAETANIVTNFFVEKTLR